MMSVIEFIKSYKYFHSMRARYVSGAVVLSLLFAASVWLTHAFISDAINVTALNSFERNKILEAHRNIRQNLVRADYSLQTYLVTPEEKEFDRVVEHLNSTLGHLYDISKYDWLKTNEMEEQISLLQKDLIDYKQSAIHLMKIRNNVEDLFPAYGTINSVMLPQNKRFVSSVRLALDDLSARLDEKEIRYLYNELNLIKDHWQDMIGAFRLYLADNAMSIKGATNKDENKFDFIVKAHYENIRIKLVKMSKMRHSYDIGIQSENSLSKMIEILNVWYKAFQKTNEIYSMGKWRLDEIYMQENIQPMNETIWGHLNKIEIGLGISSQGDVNKLATVASGVNSMLWLRMLVSLLFVVSAFFAFEYWVLRPISRITHALKAEAEGSAFEELPEPNTHETRELVEAFHEMRTQVNLRQIELRHQTLHDNLTDLPNRLYLHNRLLSEIQKAEEHKQELALLMVDLDRFKAINDTLGHHMGDRVLREIGPRFMGALSENDFLARLGGDEFAVIIPDTTIEHANHVAMRLSESLGKEFNIEGQRLLIGSSIGIAMYPAHGKDQQSLLQRSDIAMYMAKRKNISYLVYDESQDEHSVWQLSFESELHDVLLNDEQIELYYQPKIDLVEDNVYGVEALLRWHHPEHGLIPAHDVHLLAEKTGLIKLLTDWVLKKAIKQLAIWNKQNIKLSIAINLSVWNLQDPDLYDFIKDLLRESGVPANRLVIEITESAVMSDPDSAIETMAKLSNLGVKLSIDDFGIGFSSLQYLKKLPVNELKIDKSFVMDMIVDENDAVIVQSTILLAHNLGLDVLAEGVESREVYDLLKSSGCDRAQGYYMGKPMSADELEGWMLYSKWVKKKSGKIKLIK